MTLTHTSFEALIDRIHTVPSLPEVMTQVVALINDPDSDARQVAAVMKTDAAMAAKMLRMVNSVYYGLDKPVNDLEHAIRILGFKTIRSVALSISVLDLFQQQNANFNMKTFWAHSTVSACLCRLIADKARLCDPEQGFTIGLLKELGKVILAENAPEETRAAIALARECRMGFTQACREVMDTDDAEIGAWLMERWGLDQTLVETVREQHVLTATTRHPRLVSMCMLSEYLCALKKIRTSGQCDEPHLDPAVWPHLDMDKTALVGVLSVINDEIENARSLLSAAG